jgi:hypothetical protein
MLGAPEHWRAWEGVLHSVHMGQPAFDHVFGMLLFPYFAAHPEAARIFDDAMTSRSGQENTAIVAAYDFAAAHTVVDVGGGQGTLLASILHAHPNARGVLVDLPHVIAPARTRMERAGQAARRDAVLPPGAPVDVVAPHQGQDLPPQGWSAGGRRCWPRAAWRS